MSSLDPPHLQHSAGSGAGIFSSALRKLSAPPNLAAPLGHAGSISRQRTTGTSGDILSATVSLSARGASTANGYSSLPQFTPPSTPPLAFGSFVAGGRSEESTSGRGDAAFEGKAGSAPIATGVAAVKAAKPRSSTEDEAPVALLPLGAEETVASAADATKVDGPVTVPDAASSPSPPTSSSSSTTSSSPSSSSWPSGGSRAIVRGSIRFSSSGKWEDEASYPPLRMARFSRCLESKLGGVANPSLASSLIGGDVVDLETLRELAWSGAPCCYRIATWQTLLGYLPLSRSRQQSAIAKKKLEYQQSVLQYFLPAAGQSSQQGQQGQSQQQQQQQQQQSSSIHKSDAEQALLRQVLVDVPRTNPGIELFRLEFVQRSLERVLYLWAMRHPASSYVQGINDLATPFYAVFLAPWIGGDAGSSAAGSGVDLSRIPASALLDVEADVYWCLTKLLDQIQDHYTPSQPGIQRMIFRLRELVHRIDEKLVVHLEGCGVEFYTFAFRWMNCLLMRELPFKLVVRLWDTCLAERDGFDGFYVYVCAALLLKFSAKLKTMRFQELVTFLQKLSSVTKDWSVKDLEELLAQAYVYKTLFTAAHMMA